jgi:hypothetical protein
MRNVTRYFELGNVINPEMIMSRFLAIGDIHGCAKTFKHLLITEFQLQKTDIVVCLGD